MSKSYRVASPGHRMDGQIVDADNVTTCDRCDGSGKVSFNLGDWETAMVRCPDCGGLGVVLGYPTLSGPPTRVVEVPSADQARSGESPTNEGMGVPVRPGRADQAVA